MAVSARMKVTSIVGSDSYKSVNMNAVYSSDPSDPNYSFSQATPAGSVSLSITNPDAFNEFYEGQVVDISFSEYRDPSQPAVAGHEETPVESTDAGTETGEPVTGP